jgi:thymidylate kinase
VTTDRHVLLAVPYLSLPYHSYHLYHIPLLMILKGKTSLVRSLTETLPAGSAWSTPTASMAAVRSVFDRRGGAVARAFYMASNYVLQYEIQQANDEHHEQQQQQQHSYSSSDRPIFVVDRWYNSTCAYSIGWKNTVGTPEESVDVLDASLFCWPVDLQLPELVILLQVNDSVRKERVRMRTREQETTEPSSINHNPWDGRLDDDENLGKRILRAMERVSGPREVIQLDASQTQEQVLRDALQVVTDRVERHYRPVDYFQTRPLEFFRWISSRLDLCDANTGIRRKHQPWAIQLALNNTHTHDGTSSSVAPSLRSVGIHSVNAAGILFFTRSCHPGGGQGGNTSLAAMVWVGGSYPSEQQWRAEGILVESTPAECELLQTLPPDSLVAHFVACQEQEQIVCDDEEEQGIESGSQQYGVTARRYDRPASYTERVARHRRENRSKHAASAFRFVPLRMEVLIGGPGSPSGPHRYEWNRDLQNICANSNGWSKARAILPFRHSPKEGNSLCYTQLHNRPITLALTGSHCAGKSTLGKKIASTMSWLFQQELGDILRDAEHVVAGGHRMGDGSGNHNAQSWDDRIYYEETTRDHQQYENENSPSSRVVETWHVGNLAWALMRKETQPGASLKDKKALVDKVKTAIREHQKESVILFVHLSINVEACLSRRQASENSSRLPMDDEQKECLDLHKNMEEKGLDLLQTDLKDLSIPLLVLDNSQDGTSAIEDSARRIVRFVHENLWRNAL